MYAQLGSDNGGIVVNLGIDGVACQAAMKLTAERNSTLNLRLRGSGLNLDLSGELVWLSATQKEAGISFKSLTANVKQDIADWIARETQSCETGALGDRPRPKPMPAMSAISATGDKFVPHSLSAAIAKFGAITAEPASSADAGSNESRLPGSPDSATGGFDATLPPEIFSPASAESPGNGEFGKTKEIEPIPGNSISPSPGSLAGATAVEKWIPPALLVSWRRGNRQRRLLFGGAAAACVLLLGLIAILAVAHIESSWSPSVGSGSPQQSTPPTAASTVPASSPQTGPLQTPQPDATVRPHSRRPPPSFLASLAAAIIGPEPSATTELDKDQADVDVWTSKSSGYYYCTDNPFYEKVSPGTFMTQGRALQSGYRPKLGQFCD